MTLRQIQWAMQHDWFSYASTCSVTGLRIVNVRCDDVKGQVVKFMDFKKLCDWAGY